MNKAFSLSIIVFLGLTFNLCAFSDPAAPGPYTISKIEYGWGDRDTNGKPVYDETYECDADNGCDPYLKRVDISSLIRNLEDSVSLRHITSCDVPLHGVGYYPSVMPPAGGWPLVLIVHG